MRSLVLAAAVLLSACGQGGPLGAGASGWRVQEIRDELTGTATQTAMLISRFDTGQVELTATCEEKLFTALNSHGRPRAGMHHVVEFRMTVFPANDDDTFSVANNGRLRASFQEGQERVVWGSVDHINSVTMEVPLAEFYGADAVTALRVEIPLLLQSATSSGQPPVSRNVVVDLMPQDENLRILLNACDPSASQAASSAPSAPTPTTPQQTAFPLGPVPLGAVSDALCVAIDAQEMHVFKTGVDRGAVVLDGSLIDLFTDSQDVRSGGEFTDLEFRIRVRIALTGPTTEAQPWELSSAPANLTLVIDGAETVVPVTYQCGLSL